MRGESNHLCHRHGHHQQHHGGGNFDDAKDTAKLTAIDRSIDRSEVEEESSWGVGDMWGG